MKNAIRGLLLDTGFLVRFLKAEDALNANATGYYKYCLEHEIPLFCSTIAIAEYCVKGDVSDLPLKDIRIVPFNTTHASRAGEITRHALPLSEKTDKNPRACVLNDIKMFAQADVEEVIDSFIMADGEALKLYKTPKDKAILKFKTVDLHATPL